MTETAIIRTIIAVSVAIIVLRYSINISSYWKYIITTISEYEEKKISKTKKIDPGRNCIFFTLGYPKNKTSSGAANIPNN